MKKTVYLHVGLHKTGTTSVQWALTFARSQLRSAGWLYPESGVPSNAPFGHHLLAWSVMKRPGFVPKFKGEFATFDEQSTRQLWSRVVDEIENSQAGNIVISSEEFDSLAEDEIAEIGSRLSAYDVVPVLVVRNTTDLLESSYRTSVIHSSYTEPADRFIENQRIRLDLPEMISEWLSVSNSQRMVILNYDDPDVRRDSVSAFLRALGVDEKLLPKKSYERQNDSFPAQIVELVRFLRSKGVGEAEIARWLKHTVHLYEKKQPPCGFIDEATAMKLDADYAAALKKMADNEAISRHVHGSLNFSPPARNVRPIRHQVDAILALGAPEMPRDGL